MHQKNRMVSIFLLCIIHTNLSESQQPHKNNVIPPVYNYSPVVTTLKLQQSLFASKLIIIPIILSIALCAQKRNIFQMITHYPFTFLALSFFTCNYFIDTICKYQQINQALNFFIFSQNINCYILSIMAIKNTMKHIHEIDQTLFDEDEFFYTIKQNTGHSFHELEIFTFELINSSLHSINNLCLDINKIDMGEKIYLLFKDKISIEHVLLLSKNNQELHADLLQFSNNPHQEYKQLTTKICTLLKRHINSFI
ncbi:MAG TPA: hypothetical protein VLG50_02760 [Candidatus Saccharimonadales bacterium]|nr:hypothetical protein [Candidatus Saccharimonadales bacterium]